MYGNRPEWINRKTSCVFFGDVPLRNDITNTLRNYLQYIDPLEIPSEAYFDGVGGVAGSVGSYSSIIMRIISGIYGRRRFDVPSTFSARPTTDFAKENIFNVISNHIDFEGVDALDLFAGTGSISFELLSRECRSVTAVEKNNAHASFIAKVAKELKTDSLTLIRGDVFRYLHSAPAQGLISSLPIPLMP